MVLCDDADVGVVERRCRIRVSIRDGLPGLGFPQLVYRVIGTWSGEPQVDQLEHRLQIRDGRVTTDAFLVGGDERTNVRDLACERFLQVDRVEFSDTTV